MRASPNWCRYPELRPEQEPQVVRAEQGRAGFPLITPSSRGKELEALLRHDDYVLSIHPQRHRNAQTNDHGQHGHH